jgi:hypothetical protein
VIRAARRLALVVARRSHAAHRFGPARIPRRRTYVPLGRGVSRGSDGSSETHCRWGVPVWWLAPRLARDAHRRTLRLRAMLPLTRGAPVVPLIVDDCEHHLHRVAGDVEDLAGVGVLPARVQLEGKQHDRRAAIGALEMCRLVRGHLAPTVGQPAAMGKRRQA